MASGLAAITIGFLLGVRHATDADHVVAVTTIVSRQRRIGAAVLIGGAWGVGHTATILVVGGAIIFFNLVIPPRLGLSMEFGVALMLVALGLLNLSGVTASIRQYAHRFTRHTHRALRDAHSALPGADPASGGAWAYVRPLVVGVVHGVAGSAAVALLVLATIPQPAWAIAYLALFGVGTVVGMMSLSTVLALPFAYTADRFARAGRPLAWVTGALSIAFGLTLAYRIGVVDGLFSSTPHWAPQ